MTTSEKLLKYLQERKRPATVAQMAHHFLTHPGTIRSALHELKTQGLADFQANASKPGRPIHRWFYRRPLALSAVPTPGAPAPHRPSAPRKWTVYDDRAYD